MTGVRLDLGGRAVLVAGASSGIGRATACIAAAAGARVMLVARREDRLREVKYGIEKAGGTAAMAVADTTDARAVEAAWAATLRAHGRVDVLVNAVGTNVPDLSLDSLSPERWQELLAVNLTSAFTLTRTAIPTFRTQGGGLIVHVASSAARRPDMSGVAYQASKAGMVGLAQGTMEEERANGVRVTVVFPGMTDTALLDRRPAPVPDADRRRALQPEDVALCCLAVATLPARAHVPELVIDPARRDG